MNTDEVLLILNSLIYADGFKLSNIEESGMLSVYDMANMGIKKPNDAIATQEEWDALLRTIKQNQTYFENIKIIDVTKRVNYEKNTAFVNYNTEKPELYVIFAGTGSGEWHDNAMGGSLLIPETPQQENALQYAQLISSRYPHFDFIVSGHSKGGNKAQYVGILFDKVKKAYSFDGQGMGKGFLLKHKDQIEKNKSKIISISAQGDFVNPLFTPIAGTIKFTKSDVSLMDLLMDTNYISIMRQHSPLSMFEENNGVLNMRNTKDVEQDETAVFLGNLVAYFSNHMSEEDFRILSHLLMHKFEHNICGDEEFQIDDIPEYFWIRLINHIIAFGEEHQLSISDIGILIFNFDVFIPIDNWQGLLARVLIVVAKGKYGILLTMGGTKLTSDRLHKIVNNVNSISEQPTNEIIRDFSSVMQETIKDTFHNGVEISELSLPKLPRWMQVSSDIENMDAWMIHQGLSSLFEKFQNDTMITEIKYELIIRDVYQKDTEFACELDKKISLIQQYRDKFSEYKKE